MSTDPAQPRRFPGDWRRLLIGVVALAALIVASVLLLTQQTAHPGRRFQSIFEDDQLLVDQPLTKTGNATVGVTLETLKSLGVDTVRVLVLWDTVAPKVTPRGFNATDPGDYGDGWAIYDRIDEAAAAVGITVYFDVSPPAPAWAVTAQPAGTPSAARADADVYGPSASDFEAFVEAAGRRYSGSYTPPDADGHALPRVSFWSVGNEPNQPGWLSPQKSPRTGQDLAPALYRSLVNASWVGLTKSGHSVSNGTILIGELAPNGCVSGVPCAFAKLGPDYAPIPPLTFLDQLYCISSSGAGAPRPLTGAAATAIACPADGSRSAFVADNPGLFDATGLAEHPYSFDLAPNVAYSLASERTFVPLASITKLETAIDSAFGAYGQSRQLPLYLTEYGYVTNPPNPHYSVTPAEQALYLDQATYIAAQNPRVRALAQFELADSNPAAECGCAPGNPRYWDSFQEGLEYVSGARKPSFAAYRLPIFLPQLESPSRDAAAHTAVEVWGMLRPAAGDGTQTAEIQWRPAGGGRYRTLTTTTTHDRSGIVSSDVDLPGSGSVRLAWTPPGEASIYSRTVAVTVR